MSDYEPTDSESDYDENEKILLKNVRKQNESDEGSEEEVYNLRNEDYDSDDDDEELANSDVEGQEIEENLPNEKAWGKERNKFYSTDYVDPDYGGFNEKDIQLAEFEEEEAKKLQKKIAQQFEEDDFGLNFLSQKESTKIDNEFAEEKIKVDLSKLSKTEKIEFLKKDSPELFSLMSEFQNKMKIYKETLQPILTEFQRGQIPNSPVIEFCQTFKDLILNYSINIYMFFLLKSEKTNLKNHPIAKRLFQYRQLIEKLEPIFNSSIKPKLKSKPTVESPVKKLKLLDKIYEEKSQKNEMKKKVRISDVIETTEIKDLDESMQIDNVADEVLTNNKRGITYQIAKNKGLTPHRKKEQRNPRVKHRNKFRKAKIRRKGAVREVRNELSRYGGELSGIKATVTKSIKIKS